MITKSRQCPVELVFKAMADRTRLRILNLLRSGEVCVCDLVAVLNVPQPKVSRHLAYLRRAGLVQARKEGHWAYYRLADNPSPLRSALLGCLAICNGDLPQFARDAEKRKLCGKTSCCD